MKFSAILICALSVSLLLASWSLQDDMDDFLAEMKSFNEFAEKNKNNKKFKAKKYRPQVRSLGSEEITEGIEAMQFLHMYRNHRRGDIGAQIDLFREFYGMDDEIPTEIFYRLAAVWLRRQHYEFETGQKYEEQEHIHKALLRQNARKFANEELRELPYEHLLYEMRHVFGDKDEIGIVTAAHWLVDGNLYSKIGVQRMKDIFQDIVFNEAKQMEEMQEIPEPAMVIDASNIEVQDEVDKIDL